MTNIPSTYDNNAAKKYSKPSHNGSSNSKSNPIKSQTLLTNSNSSHLSFKKTALKSKLLSLLSIKYFKTLKIYLIKVFGIYPHKISTPINNTHLSQKPMLILLSKLLIYSNCYCIDKYKLFKLKTNKIHSFICQHIKISHHKIIILSLINA